LRLQHGRIGLGEYIPLLHLFAFFYFSYLPTSAWGLDSPLMDPTESIHIAFRPLGKTHRSAYIIQPNLDQPVLNMSFLPPRAYLSDLVSYNRHVRVA
jgi:hypothetical protein